MNFIISLMISVFYAHSAAASEVPLTESYLQTLIEQRPPSVQQIETSFLTVKQSHLSAEDRLSLKLQADGSYYRSEERLLNQFDAGVTQSASSYSVGVVKPTRYGVDLSLKAFAEKATNIFVSDAATNGAVLGLSVDLYQDFLGRKTNSNLKKGEEELKRAELEKKARLKTFESNVRKLYWALVANEEQRKLLRSLTKASESQYREAARRKRSGAADSGEVARFHSQWSTRKSELLSLDYRRGDLLRSLKELLPNLNGKEVTVGKYDVQETVGAVLACTEVIRRYKKAPFKNTPYDEIADHLQEEARLDRLITERYSGPNLKLMGEFSSVGRGLGFSASRDNFFNEARPRTSLRLEFSMPLDGKMKKTEEVLEQINKNRYHAEAKENLAKVDAYHSETVRLVQTLRDVLKNQKDTNKYLSQSLRSSKRKYKQARISLEELISEQEAHLQSQLSVIDSQLTIINTLIDYFGIFLDTPCKFNDSKFGLTARK